MRLCSAAGINKQAGMVGSLLIFRRGLVQIYFNVMGFSLCVTDEQNDLVSILKQTFFTNLVLF